VQLLGASTVSAMAHGRRRGWAGGMRGGAHGKEVAAALGGGVDGEELRRRRSTVDGEELRRNLGSLPAS